MTSELKKNVAIVPGFLDTLTDFYFETLHRKHFYFFCFYLILVVFCPPCAHTQPALSALLRGSGSPAVYAGHCFLTVAVSGDLCGLSSQGQPGSLHHYSRKISLHSLAGWFYLCALEAAGIIHVLSMWIVANLLCIIWLEKTSDWYHEQHW